MLVQKDTVFEIFGAIKKKLGRFISDYNMCCFYGRILLTATVNAYGESHYDGKIFQATLNHNNH